ncbi:MULTISPECIES: DUF4011 domain-containing protein [unclassified Paracoccus (in: a-proteobacteria)]|uniref:DUF4011 domain-containing protein n=1 Tax=unclassified Paracoccus (in: a-proteobacteria) TaxID=2688777 RepID=UPI0021E1482F|nr:MULTISPECIES: DUF4011 domain-containing protein [unclassified Paracoccus (in: a-proteobacteria)]UXU76622.1 DUF4011 domain-containing protein [Paracoccus sp. SMMA_5]UXU82510.1 DUF4011 domain-containing protein [Paracoccus sp. SMMA_5_TC]
MEADLEDLGPIVVDSALAGDGTLAEKLDRARTELLDLSARNRLLNMPKSARSARMIEVVDERSSEIFRLLVAEARAMTFLPGRPSRKAEAEAGDEGSAAAPEDTDIIEDLALPEDDEIDARGIAGRHADNRLQTRLTPEGLQKRLLDLYYDARTLEDEQGVNVLYLTLGALRWTDPVDRTNLRHAPLLLIPVALERGTAGERFRLKARPEDCATNLSLENFLDRLHGIRLPEVELSDGFDLPGYFDAVAAAVAHKDGWGVEPDMVALGFFSFAKFLMYRDLDPANWPAAEPITAKPLLKGLLSDGFEAGPPLFPEDRPIDQIVGPADLHHILDSDSSQTLAVHEVRQGRNLVIQGPPGTGKSQTIANLIAAAVADGKTVLFVAEKMAALEVVKRRLDASGVGAACLELHSRQANKRAVLEEIRRTWENGAPRTAEIGALNARLAELRDALNGHALRLHRRDPVSGLTPYQVIGHLVRLRAQGEPPGDIVLDSPGEWTGDGYLQRHAILRELVERVQQIGNPAGHVWHGVGLAHVSPMEVERLTARLGAAAQSCAGIAADSARLAARLHAPAPGNGKALAALIDLARRLQQAPLTREALAGAAWADAAGLRQVLCAGARASEIRQELHGWIADAAWQGEAWDARAPLRALATDTAAPDFAAIADLAGRLPAMIAAARDLAALLGEAPPRTMAGIEALAGLARHVAAAPPAPAAALADASWEMQPGVAGDIVAGLRVWQEARAALDGKMLPAAWDIDLAPARQLLASHGESMFRKLSGAWRRADRLVRSCLVDPDQPLAATLQQLDLLGKAKAARAEIAGNDAAGRAAFGGLWRAERSDIAQLEAVLSWQATLAEAGGPVRRIVAREPVRADVARLLEQLADLSAMRAAADRLVRVLGDAGDADVDGLAARAAELTAAEQTSAGAFLRLPPRLDQRLALLDLLEEGRRCEAALHRAGDDAAAAFGPLWQGAGSDWVALLRAWDWVAANPDLARLGAEVADRAAAAALADDIARRSDALGSDLERLAGDLELDMARALGGDPDHVPIAALTARLQAWAGAGESLFQWTAYRDRASQARQLGCADVVDRLEDGRLHPERVVSAFELAYFEAMYQRLIAADPELARFDGELHARTVAEFAACDLQRIRVSADETVRAHYRRVPPREGGAIGPLGVLRNELQKRRGHMPIRKLVERAGPALQALKPVFMMSPLSVAQFLPPGAVEFDLLVMDEASQIQPVDALGAVARARQVVVVGDPRQLPPTSFFARMTAGGDEDEDDTHQVADIESILGLFTARGLPMRMLRWHYRSRHQSLIAVSNRQFYDGKLFVVPSPYTAEAGMGLRFHHVADGIFDAGGKRCNPAEARVVARLVGPDAGWRRAGMGFGRAGAGPAGRCRAIHCAAAGREVPRLHRDGWTNRRCGPRPASRCAGGGTAVALSCICPVRG